MQQGKVIKQQSNLPYNEDEIPVAKKTPPPKASPFGGMFSFLESDIPAPAPKSVVKAAPKAAPIPQKKPTGPSAAEIRATERANAQKVAFEKRQQIAAMREKRAREAEAIKLKKEEAAAAAQAAKKVEAEKRRLALEAKTMKAASVSKPATKSVI